MCWWSIPLCRQSIKEFIAHTNANPGKIVIAYGGIGTTPHMATQLTTIKSGRVRALAVTSAERNAFVPDTPTLIESGVSMEVTAWYGLCAPAGVPKPILARINADVVKALGTPDVRQRFADIGLDVEPQTPEQFAALIQSETAKWAKVIKDARIPQQ
jgi:tripartite-type tricarboxylate transporter receptor subunit TctC